MRLVVPAALAAALIALSLSGCFASGENGAPPSGRLAVGVSEANPNLLAPGPATPFVFAERARDLAGIRFTHYRLIVSWAAVQPRPDAPPDWDVASPGCMRALGPCAAYGGVRAQLRALRARAPRAQVLVSLLSTPAWAASGPSGCEVAKTVPQSRAPTAAGLVAYRALVRSLLDLGAREGVALRWWSPWNEPNAGYFFGPQRTRCDPTSASLSSFAYARLARAMSAELAAAAGDQRLVLGEVSAAAEPKPLLTTVGEWATALPRDVACSSDVWGLHLYAGDDDVLGELVTALDARGCPRRARVWITETGVGAARPGKPRTGGEAALRQGCRRMDALLREFREHPRVDVAIQYSLREDDQFPVGLVDTALTRTYPALDLWRAWSQRPSGDPPPLPASCR